MTWQRAAAIGLLFAIVSCVWRFFADDPGFDELAIRFSVYFLGFTVGFYFLYNLLAKQKP